MVTALALALLGCTTENGKDADTPDTGGPVGDSEREDSADTGDTASDSGDSADTGDSATDTDTGDAPCDDTTDTAEDGPDDDGDGFTDASHGGDDCDDERAHGYPGAPDACDGLDQDCDGEAIPPGSCSEAMEATVSAWTTIVGDEARQATDIYASVSPAMAGGDAWLAWEASSGEGLRTTGFLVGSEFLARATYPAEEWRGWSDSYRVAGWPAGDVDGDGAPDAWIWWSPPATGVGAFLLKLGPLEDVTCGVEDPWTWADAEFQNSDPEYEALNLLDSAADVDGDGRDDFLVALSPWDESAPDELHLITGEAVTDMEGYELATTTPMVLLTADDQDQNTAPEMVPDITGDGLDDLIGTNNCGDSHGSRRGLTYFSGADFVAAAAMGNELHDVPHVSICGTDETSQVDTYFASGHTLPGDRATDFSGDGHPDVLAVYAAEVDGDDVGALTFLDLSRADVAPLEELQLTQLDYGEGRSFNDAQATDFGDLSLDEQWLAIDGAGATTCIVSLAMLPPGGRVATTDLRSPCVLTSLYREYYTQLKDLHDLDGDGLPEWIFSDYYGYEVDGLDVGRIEIVRGFDIPYDDDTRW